MIRAQIELTEKQSRALKKIAARKGVSFSKLMRQYVDRILSLERISKNDKIRQRAIAAAGCVHSGTGDLSEKHDDYLAEAFSD